jgi:hypothetical protein
MVTSGFLVYFARAAHMHCANSIYVLSYRVFLALTNPYENVFVAQKSVAVIHFPMNGLWETGTIIFEREEINVDKILLFFINTKGQMRK